MGSVYITRTVDGQSDIQQLESVKNLGVAGDFIVLTYEDDTTVLEKVDSIDRVQFTPATPEDQGSAEGKDDTGN